MASPLSQGLFDKAIGQSGAFWESENTPSARPLADAHKAGSALAAKLGAPSLAALREVSALTLQRTTNWTLRTDPGVTHWAPVIDGLVLPESPYDRYAKGLQMKLPLLVGWNASEGLPLFANRSLMWAPPGAPAKTVADFRAAAQAKFGADRLDEFLSLYPGATLEQAQRSANQLIGDEAIAYQVWAWAVAQQRTAGTPVYVYHFTHRSAFLPLAMHTAEIPFAFGDLSGGFATGPKSAVVPGPDDLLLAERMSSFWINFARSGNPNGDGLPQWPRFEGPGSQVIQLNSAPGPVADPDVARHRFLHRWKSRE